MKDLRNTGLIDRRNLPWIGLGFYRGRSHTHVGLQSFCTAGLAIKFVVAEVTMVTTVHNTDKVTPIYI